MLFWVTGKKGLLGQTFVDILTKKGLAFSATSKDEVDITQLEDVESYVKEHSPTHIINCSAYTHVDNAENEKEKAYACNVEGVQNLATACNRNGAKLIHFSSDYVFDGAKKSSMYTENDLPNPVNYYGKTKLWADEYLLKHLEDVLILRVSWVFGRYGENLVTKLHRWLSSNEVVKMVDDQVSRITYADDIVHATLLLLEEKGVYNFANQIALSRFDLAKYIFEWLTANNYHVCCKEVAPAKAADFVAKAKRPNYCPLDTGKIEKKA